MNATFFPKRSASQSSIRHFCRVTVLLQSVLLILCLQGSPAQGRNPVSGSAATHTGKLSKNVEAPMKTSGVLYQSGNRRDPFLNPLLITKKEKLADEEVSRGVPPPGIAGTYIDQAVLQGIALRDHKRVAIVRGADTRAYFLNEGDRLFDGYLKTIEIDSITLIRETKMRSGKVLVQEVTKRLRKP